MMEQDPPRPGTITRGMKAALSAIVLFVVKIFHFLKFVIFAFVLMLLTMPFLFGLIHLMRVDWSGSYATNPTLFIILLILCSLPLGLVHAVFILAGRSLIVDNSKLALFYGYREAAANVLPVAVVLAVVQAIAYGFLYVIELEPETWWSAASFTAAMLIFLFLFLRLAYTTIILVVERVGLIEALRRSWRFTAGRFWATALGLLVAVSPMILCDGLPALLDAGHIMFPDGSRYAIEAISTAAVLIPQLFLVAFYEGEWARPSFDIQRFSR
ncbi:MAG TPA: hypothetical protein PKW95_09400 [bacterium]|nr:hypothetical protein [bacterium]